MRTPKKHTPKKEGSQAGQDSEDEDYDKYLDQILSQASIEVTMEDSD